MHTCVSGKNSNFYAASGCFLKSLQKLSHKWTSCENKVGRPFVGFRVNVLGNGSPAPSSPEKKEPK